jgi:outer membrane protein assembly factor BamB
VNLKLSSASLIVLLLSMMASAQEPERHGRRPPGSLLWEDRVDESLFEQAFSSAAGKGRLFVAGFVSASNFRRDFVLRAYDLSTGALLWSDRVDGNQGGDDFAVAVETDGKTVWAAGNITPVSPFPDRDWLVRAYDAATGAVIWQDVFDHGGQRADGVQGRALLLNDGILHVGGSGATSAFLRVDAPPVEPAFRGPINWLPWSRRMSPPVSGSVVEASSVALPDGDVRGDVGCRVGNNAGPSPFPPGSLSGAVLVADIPRGMGCPVQQVAENAAAAGALGVILVMPPGERALVFGSLASVPLPVVTIVHEAMIELRALLAAGTSVAVTLSDEFAGKDQAVVRSYDAASGTLIWQDAFDRGGRGLQQARSFAVSGKRLFVAGLSTSPVADEVALRAYDSATGVLEWEHYTPGVKGLFTFARSVVASGKRVFVGSSVETAVGVEFLVQAHHAVTGAVLWEDRPQDKGTQNFLFDIAAQGSRVVAVGGGGRECTSGPSSNCDIYVRSYHGPSGRLKWERRFDLTGLDDAPQDVVVGQGMVYFSSIGAFVSDDGGQSHLHTLDEATGATQWHTTGGVLEWPLDLTLHQNRIIIPGRAVDPVTDNWDIIVRVYDARPGR